eukprot:TRINITY_DN73467_c0_g1_i1.p2 TRINITY_DN73467_c0_g1~~TRINITY_DN73467_c0_g1_i1.p2  ORF type:complete len:251 (-),score=48.62 TRINITY_DN73467_c0_g1_i1:160-843(-)
MACDAIPQPRGLDTVVGTNLEPFLRGFQQGSFRAVVEAFVTEHAASFEKVCPDGSHPLEWTTLHSSFRELFETQLDAVLCEQDVERDEFAAWVSSLEGASRSYEPDFVLPGSGGVMAGDFHDFLEALTASEDYDFFLKTMFAACCARRDPSLEAAPTSQQELPQRTTHDIEVPVPEGRSAGETVSVEYLGVHHELRIPDGCAPGTTFRAAVAVPERRTRGAPLPLRW